MSSTAWVPEIIPTGIAALDWVEGGVPKGRITQVTGDVSLPEVRVPRWDMRGLDLAFKSGAPIISLDSWHPPDLTKLTVIIMRRGTALIIRYPWGIELPKALKFFPSLRLSVRGDVVTCIKNMLSVPQDRTRRLGPVS